MNHPTSSQYSIHSPPLTRRIISSLISTSLWGFFETLILDIVHFIDYHLWPNFHTQFMRVIHHRFGGIVTPFDISFENDPSKRNWEGRTPYTSRFTKNGQEILDKGQLTILPTQEIFNLLIRSNVNPSVAICYCRNHMKKHGYQCELDAPLRTCLTLRLPQSISTIRTSKPQLNETQQKALYTLLTRCEKIGLVHQVVFYKRYNTYVICNCCPDCCEVLSPLFRTTKEKKYHQKKLERYLLLHAKKQQNDLTPLEIQEYKTLRKSKKMHQKGTEMDPVPLVARSAFIAVQDSAGECINCGKCAERCYFGARIMKEGKLQYHPDLCYGCGLCINTCLQSVIRLKKRSKSKDMSPINIGIQHNHPHFSKTKR